MRYWMFGTVKGWISREEAGEKCDLVLDALGGSSNVHPLLYIFSSKNKLLACRNIDAIALEFAGPKYRNDNPLDAAYNYAVSVCEKGKNRDLVKWK